MRIAVSLVVVALAAGPAGAQFVAPGGTIPVVANLPGKAGTFWRSDVVLTNLGPATTTVVLELFPELRGGTPAFTPPDPVQVTLAAGEQRVLSNVVQSVFGLQNVKGALRFYTTDGAPLAFASRTWTPGGGGSYGQSVEGVLVAGEAWIPDLEEDGFYRTNIGIFWPWDQAVEFTVTIHAGDGSVVAQRSVRFDGAGLQQLSLDPTLGVASLPAGYAHIRCPEPALGFYAYASRVDQATGDAVFRAAMGRLSDLGQ